MTDRKVAIVTGAARGIGRATALRFAAEGMHVVAGDLSGEGLATLAAECGAQTLVTDVADEAACHALIALAADRFGRVDYLINSAGISGAQAPLTELKYADVEAVLRTNLLGSFACMQAAAPHMIRQRHGAIVTIGSTAAKFPTVNRIAYASAKAGLIGLTRVAATELAPHGVRCNLISPGPVAGPRLDEVIGRIAATKAIPLDQAREEMMALMPMREPTTPEEIADVALFLCSPAARHLTGEDINVDSGIPAY